MALKMFLQRYLKIIVLQFVFVTLIIIAVTVIRFLSPDLFEEIRGMYWEYFGTEISLSLVLDGV